MNDHLYILGLSLCLVLLPLLMVSLAFKLCLPCRPKAPRAARHRTGCQFPSGDLVQGDTFTYQGIVWEWSAKQHTWVFLRRAPRAVWWR